MGLPEPIARRAEDEAAQTRALFDEYGRMVLVLCQALLRDRPDAEDAAQQTFLAAYRSLLAGHRPRHPAAWLATIARNECRARQGNGDDLSVPLPLEIEAANGDPAVIAADRAELSALRDALAELPERQREVVRLHCLEGFTYGEVAQILDISSRAVDGLLVRARNRLRRRMRDFSRAGPLVVADALRDRLAQLVPGFEQGGGAVALAAGSGAGGLAAAGSAPLTAKLAVGAVGVAVLGSAGAKAPAPAPSVAKAHVAAKQAPRPEPSRPALGARAGRAEAAVTLNSSRRGRSGEDERRGDSSGPGPGRGRDRDSLRGPGGGDDRRSIAERDHEESAERLELARPDNSGPGSSGSGRSGSGGSTSSSGSGSSGSGSSGSGSSGSGSSGSGSSGSGSGSGSSGPGSEEPKDPD